MFIPDSRVSRLYTQVVSMYFTSNSQNDIKNMDKNIANMFVCSNVHPQNMQGAPLV